MEHPHVTIGFNTQLVSILDLDDMIMGVTSVSGNPQMGPKLAQVIGYDFPGKKKHGLWSGLY